MKSTSHIWIFPAVLAVLLTITACYGPFYSATSQPATEQAGMDAQTVRTQIYQTVVFDMTQTAAVLPTGTPTEQPTVTYTYTTTFTPTITETSTPKATLRPANTATRQPQEFECYVKSQSPKSGTRIHVNDDFDGSWIFVNSGTEDWDKNEIDFVQISGVETTSNDAFDLPKSVDTGDSVQILLDMKAPSDTGTQNATWALRKGNVVLCYAYLSIVTYD
jgi:hypothetical protein